MNLKSLKSQENNKKGCFFNGKIAKSPKIITYTTSLFDLEFIQRTGSSRGRAKSSRPRRQVKKARRRSYRYVENVFGRQRRHRALQPAAIERGIWIHSFKENKPNLKNIKIGVSPFKTNIYEILTAWRSKKQTQYKPNSNPIFYNAIIGLSSFITGKYVKFENSAGEKTNPISNPIFSELVKFIQTHYFLQFPTREEFFKFFTKFYCIFYHITSYYCILMKGIEYAINVNRRFSCLSGRFEAYYLQIHRQRRLPAIYADKC